MQCKIYPPGAAERKKTGNREVDDVTMPFLVGLSAFKCDTCFQLLYYPPTFHTKGKRPIHQLYMGHSQIGIRTLLYIINYLKENKADEIIYVGDKSMSLVTAP